MVQGSGKSHHFFSSFVKCAIHQFWGSDKLGWKKEVDNWKRENGCKEVEIEFIKILKLMNDRIITKQKINNGFRGYRYFSTEY